MLKLPGRKHSVSIQK